MAFSNLAQVVSLLLIGPSLLFHVPDEEWVVLTGVALLGASSASGPAFVTVETVSPSVEKFPAHYDRIADLASSLRNMMYGMGQCSGALFGGILRRVFGFEHGL